MDRSFFPFLRRELTSKQETTFELKLVKLTKLFSIFEGTVKRLNGPLHLKELILFLSLYSKICEKKETTPITTNQDYQSIKLILMKENHLSINIFLILMRDRTGLADHFGSMTEEAKGKALIEKLKEKQICFACDLAIGSFKEIFVCVGCKTCYCL